MLSDAGVITGFIPKKVFPLIVYDGYGMALELKNKKGGYLRSIPTYESDFTYYDDDTWRVEDVKTKNPKADDPVFKIKAKFFEAVYGFPITILRM